jgi:hypothetical protein
VRSLITPGVDFGSAVDVFESAIIVLLRKLLNFCKVFPLSVATLATISVYTTVAEYMAQVVERDGVTQGQQSDVETRGLDPLIALERVLGLSTGTTNVNGLIVLAVVALYRLSFGTQHGDPVLLRIRVYPIYHARTKSPLALYFSDPLGT